MYIGDKIEDAVDVCISILLVNNHDSYSLVSNHDSYSLVSNHD